MTRSVRIGTLTFRVYNESRDKQHVNIEVTDDGNDSAGNIDCTLREWHALQNASLSATSHAAQLAEINRVQVQRDRAHHLLRAIRDDFDRAIAAHDPSDSRHPSHGGQHTNGRCCAFGNLNPGAVSHMRWLLSAIDAIKEQP